MKDEKIVYVAYSPYENQGKVLDFILENFRYVFVFSIGHHNIGRDKVTNKLTIYKNKKKIDEVDLYRFPIPSSLVFLLLPVRSFLNFMQIFVYVYKLKNKYNKLNIYFAVNGFAAWIGVVLKKFGLVEKNVYWVTDYYPINHKSKIITFMRWLYWNFEKQTADSDKLAFHNNRLVRVWKKEGVLSQNYKAILIPIGTGRSTFKKAKRYGKKVILCFLGVLKKTQGLDYIFDSAELLKKEFPNIVVEIIGPGPDRDYFEKRAEETKLECNFYGYVFEKDIDRIISNSTVGIATYVPDPSNVSYYGDPGKIKRYISLGIPVIATKIHEFSYEVEKKEAGILLEYGNSRQLVKAVKSIVGNYDKYCNNAIKLSKKLYYKKIYQPMFSLN